MPNPKKQYWEKFYKKFDIKEPSNFAHFVLNYIPNKAYIIELGCGTGRDIKFFGSMGYPGMGVDYASSPKNTNNIIFLKKDLNYFLKNYHSFKTNTLETIIYTRFFLHTITNHEITKLLNWSKGIFLAEFRAKEDKPILYPNHYRNHIDENKLLKQMIQKGFKIIYFSKSRDVAKYKNENPLIIRIVAKKG